jgi:hypothetical protein
MPGLLVKALRLQAVLRAMLALAAAVALAAMAIAWHPWPRHGADRLRHLVQWPACAAVTVEPVRVPDAWPHAKGHTMVDCEMLGPWVAYARFPDRRALQTDLLAASPDSAVCLYGHGTEVAVDGLDAQQFRKLCNQLHGDRIDGVAGLPDYPGGNTYDSTNRAVERQSRRDTQAQHRALARYFSRTP